MIMNPFREISRTFKRARGYSFIILTGLSLAFSASLVIGFHIRYELSYDRFIPAYQNVYRVTRRFGTTQSETVRTCPPLADMALKLMPGLESAARIYPINRQLWSSPINAASKSFFMENCLAADPGFCTMFDLKFIRGNASNALQRPDSIILSESMAQKHFPNRESIGQTLVLKAGDAPFVVSAIVRDLPSNTHLSFDCLIPMEGFFRILERQGNVGLRTTKGWDGPVLYLKKKPQAKLSDLNALLPDLTHQVFGDVGTSREELLKKTQYRLQPISEIHLHSHLIQEISTNSSFGYIIIFAAIALLILLIASINFINIFTALAIKRMKEVAIRKLAGASAFRLFGRFLFESLIFMLSALILSLACLGLFSPLYQNLTGNSLELSGFLSTGFFLPSLGIFLLFTLLTVIYPAATLNRFEPQSALKGAKQPKSSISLLRKGLVVFQFTLAIGMIFATLVVGRQLHFFFSYDLGFDKQDILAVSLEGDLKTRYIADPQALKGELLHSTVIRSVGICDNLPGDGLSYSLEPLYLQSEPDDTKRPSLRWTRVDDNFLKTLDIPIREGTDFTQTQAGSSDVIINRAAEGLFIEKNLIGKPCRTPGGTVRIVGIVDDFHFASLHGQVEPLVLAHKPDRGRYLLIKTAPGQMSRAIDLTQQTLTELAPNQPFNYLILDDHLNQLYLGEVRVGKLFNLFAFLAIIIACLGMLGMTIYTGEIRTREIGIRKVLGISIANTAWLLFRENLYAVFLASTLAFGLGFPLMNRWLEQFAFHTNIGLDQFIWALLLTLLITIISNWTHTWRASRVNPIDCLRYE
jgi:putative ABC transport system permease protein